MARYFIKVRPEYVREIGDVTHGGFNWRIVDTCKPYQIWADPANWNANCPPKFRAPEGIVVEDNNPDGAPPYYPIRRHFDGWRIVELNNIVEEDDVWHRHDDYHPPSTHEEHRVDQGRVGKRLYDSLKETVSMAIIQKSCLWRKLVPEYKRRILPMNPTFANPLPLPK